MFIAEVLATACDGDNMAYPVRIDFVLFSAVFFRWLHLQCERVMRRLILLLFCKGALRPTREPAEYGE